MTKTIVDVLVVGAGQSGLGAGYYLQKADVSYLIVDSAAAIGDSWRNRWDSLRLFTPKLYATLPGTLFARSADFYPTKNQMADYLEAYATDLDLNVQLNSRVERIVKNNDGFVASIGSDTVHAKNIIIATGPFQTPFVPDFADALGAHIEQIHSSAYDNAASISGRRVVVVGGGNSAAQIAVELADKYDVTITTSRKPRFIPKEIYGISIYHFLSFFRILSSSKHSWISRILRKRPESIIGTELKKGISAARVKLVPERVVDCTKDGVVTLSGRTIAADHVIWATGFRPSYDYIDIDGSLDRNGAPILVDSNSDIKGLYWLGLPWQFRLDSSIVHGVNRDARQVCAEILQAQPDVILK